MAAFDSCMESSPGPSRVSSLRFGPELDSVNAQRIRRIFAELDGMLLVQHPSTSGHQRRVAVVKIRDDGCPCKRVAEHQASFFVMSVGSISDVTSLVTSFHSWSVATLTCSR